MSSYFYFRIHLTRNLAILLIIPGEENLRLRPDLKTKTRGTRHEKGYNMGQPQKYVGN